MLVLDKSGSMYGLTSQVKAFASELVSQFALSPTLTRVGVVEFSSSARVLTGLSGSASVVAGAIAGLSNAGGWTSISSGLERGKGLIDAGGRPCAGENCVVFLLTDGQQSSQYGGSNAAVLSAAAVKAADMRVFAVGFGGAQKSTLDAMASSPASQYSYLGTSLADIRAHFQAFCQLVSSPRPPSEMNSE